MENNNNVPRTDLDPREWHLPAKETGDWQIRSAEDGFDDEYEMETARIYASAGRDDDEDDDRDDDNDDDDDDDLTEDLTDDDGLHNDNWGNVDPQANPAGRPDPMDQSGPGSAV